MYLYNQKVIMHVAKPIPSNVHVTAVFASVKFRLTISKILESDSLFSTHVYLYRYMYKLMYIKCI